MVPNETITGMRTIWKVVIDICLAVAVGLAVVLFEALIPYLPLICLVLLGHYTWELGTSKFVLSRFAGAWIRAKKGNKVLSYLLVGVIGAGVFCVYWWGLNAFFAPKIAAYEATQNKGAKSELPTVGFQDDSDIILVTFGSMTAGNHIAMLKQRQGQPVSPINYEGYSPIQLEYLDGKVSYSVKFWSPTQNSVIEVKDGKFILRNSDLDLNYSSRALEVVTSDGYPILQIIWLTPSHMRLNGLFPLPNGQLLCMSNDSPKTVESTSTIDACAITPIFKHPSWKYLGIPVE